MKNQSSSSTSSIPQAFLAKRPKLASDKDELRSFYTGLCATVNYLNDAAVFLDKQERDLNSLSPFQKSLLKFEWAPKRKRYEECFAANFAFLLEIVKDELDIFAPKQLDGDYSFNVPSRDVSKIRSALRQFKREWSAEGAHEREASYTPLLEGLKKYFPQPQGVKVLVPGCGLGRLPFEIASLGFACEGNEFSVQMQVCLKYIFSRFESTRIFPSLNFTMNIVLAEDIFESCVVPDTKPDLSKLNLTFKQGNFLTEYSSTKGKWDCLVTCYFIDTGNNVLEYLQCIYSLLKPGGIWLNCGPLLYHKSGVKGEISIDLAMDEIFFAAEKLGFKILDKSTTQGLYCSQKNSMMEYLYKNQYFACVKEPRFLDKVPFF